MTKTARILLASVLVATSCAIASAQQAPPARIRGTIEKVDGNTLTVKASSGTVMIKLNENPRITAMVKAQLSDIKPGSFIGVTAMPQPDGSQKAIGLHIFLPAQKGVVREGFTPWDREPGSTMTNADVTSTVAGVDGQTIMVKYPDGEKKVIVPPNTNIVAFTPGSKDDLKPGAAMIMIAGQKQPDGSYTTAGVNVGRDGATPPM